MEVVFGVLLAVVLSLQLGVILGWRWGRRHGQRLEVRSMIDLMEAIKIDSYEQRVFRDRFVRALEWSLSHRTKEEGGE